MSNISKSWPRAGGGLRAIRYVFRQARSVGGIRKLYQALATKNACKTCAVGMGGQRGGMVNERGGWPEVCKKSVQAMTADMQGAIPESFWTTYSLAQLREFTPRQLESAGRITRPIVIDKGQTHFRVAAWEEFFADLPNALREYSPEQTFWYFSGRSSNEAGFLLQLFARVYGSNHVNNCSYYCHQASGVGLTSSIGSGTATLSLDDLNQCDTLFLIGGNPASNHPRLMTNLMKIRRRGGRVIVINPVVELGLERFKIPSDPRSLLFGTEIASTYVQPHIGGDLALLNGVAKQLLESNGVDDTFLNAHCENIEAYLANLKALDWDSVYRQSGVERETIRDLTELYIKARKTVFAWTMGITHHSHGVQNVQAIANLALLRGMIGKRGAGLLPIRGHSNVQGMGTVGVTPTLQRAIFERIESRLSVSLPKHQGLDTLGCMEAAARGEMKLAFCLGGNLYGSNPESEFAQQALSQLRRVIYLNTTLNTGHMHGIGEKTWILPVLARDEEPEATTQESMFNFVRLSNGGNARHSGPRREIDIIAELAEKTLGENTPISWPNFRQANNIREAIAKTVPGLERLDEIEHSRQEFSINGRLLHQPKFPTKSGKATLHVHDLAEPEPTTEVDRTRPDGKAMPEREDSSVTLRLMTVRSEGQFNTVVYEEEDLYRQQERRDVILIHPDDLTRLGFHHNQRVDVTSACGQLDNVLARAFERIRPGNVLMYYPEANRLVPRTADPKSRTPAFKNVPVRIQAAAS